MRRRLHYGAFLGEVVACVSGESGAQARLSPYSSSSLSLSHRVALVTGNAARATPPPAAANRQGTQPITSLGQTDGRYPSRNYIAAALRAVSRPLGRERSIVPRWYHAQNVCRFNHDRLRLYSYWNVPLEYITWGGGALHDWHF